MRKIKMLKEKYGLVIVILWFCSLITVIFYLLNILDLGVGAISYYSLKPENRPPLSENFDTLLKSLTLIYGSVLILLGILMKLCSFLSKRKKAK